MSVLHMSTFTTSKHTGGKHAGVVLDSRGYPEELMQIVAAETGLPVTVFAVPRSEGTLTARFFDSRSKVGPCAHAMIALAVAHARRHGPGELLLFTKNGSIPVTTCVGDGVFTGTVTSVPPRVTGLPLADLDELLASLRWGRRDLAPHMPPRVAYTGARHAVVAVETRMRLEVLRPDKTALAVLMERHGWSTVELVWPREPGIFVARNLAYSPAGIYEDPASGSAAAALGAVLRAGQVFDTPATVRILQGFDLGRPSSISVYIPSDPGTGIDVTGMAVEIPHQPASKL